MATLAEAAVEIIAELDSFEPDLRRKLTRAVQAAADDAEREFRKAGKKSGTAFADATAQTAGGAASDGRFAKAGQIAGSDFGGGFVSRANRSFDQFAPDISTGLDKAVQSAARTAEQDLGAAGTNSGEVFARNLRKTVSKSSTRTGNEAGGFFSRAFETASQRLLGSGLVKVFAGLAGGLVASVGPLGTILGGASAAVVALAAAIGQASGAAVAFGGVLGSLGLAAAAVKVGFAGVGDAVKAQSKALAELNATGKVSASTQEALDAALKNLAPNARAVVLQLGAMAPAWEKVRAAVQNNLFAGVAKALADLGARFLPILTAQLGTAASTLSKFATGFAAFLTATPQADQLTGIFASLNRILAILLPAVQPLAAGFLTLFTASLPFAERLAGVLAGFGPKLEKFASTAVAGGGFKTFLEGAFAAAKNLLGLLGNLGSIIGSVFSAGAANGNSLLGVLEELTGDLAAFLKSTEGQSALASFFGLIGAAGKVLQGIFTTLNPLIAGVQTLFTALAPVLTQLGAAMQPVILAFTTLVGSALTQLAPIIAQLLTGLTPLIAALGQGLVTVLGAVLQAIIPILPTIVQFATTLAANLVPVINALVPVLVQIAAAFGQFLLAVAPLLPQLLPLIPPLAQIAIAFVQLLAALTPLLVQFAQLAAVTAGQVAQGLQVVIPFIVALANHMVNVINVVTRVVTAIVNFVGRAVALFNQFRQAGASDFQAFVGTATAIISSLVSKVLAFFGRLVSGTLQALGGLVSSGAAAAGRVASGIRNAITTGLSNLVGALKTAGSNAINGFIGGLEAGLGKVRSIAGQIAAAVTGPVGKFLDIGSPSKVMHALGDDTVQGYINAIREKIPAVQAALSQLARAVPAQVKTAIGQVNTALGSLGKALTSTTRLRLNTLVAAARTSLGVLTAAQDSLDKRAKTAQDNLKSLLQQSQQFTSQVFSNITQNGNITGGQEQSFAGIVARLTQARDAARRFQEVLAQLSKSGLSKASLQQIAEAGPEAGLRAGEAVLAAGRSGIAQINKLQAQLQAAAQKAATTAANALFGQGIRVADGIVAGLARQKKALDLQMQRLGDVLVARIVSVLRAAGVRGLSIPGFANGGLITRPTLATFAEKGPEVAIPLNQPARRDQLLDRYFGGWADQRAWKGGPGYGASTTTSTKTVHMPITVQGLSKDETTQVLHGVLDRRLGPHIGITTSGGDL